MFSRSIKQGNNTTFRTTTTVPTNMIGLRTKDYKVARVIVEVVAVFVMYLVGFSKRIKFFHNPPGYSLPLSIGDVVRVMQGFMVTFKRAVVMLGLASATTAFGVFLATLRADNGLDACSLRRVNAMFV